MSTRIHSTLLDKKYVWVYNLVENLIIKSCVRPIKLVVICEEVIMFKKVISVFFFCFLVVSFGCSKRQTQQEAAEKSEVNYLKGETIRIFHEVTSSAEVISTPEKIRGSETMFVKVKYSKYETTCFITALTNEKDLKVGEKIVIRTVLERNGAMFNIADKLVR